MRVAYVLPGLQSPSGWRTLSRGAIDSLSACVEPVLFVQAGDEPEARRLFPGLPAYALPATQPPMISSPTGFAALARTLAAVSAGRFPPVDLVHALEAYPSGLVARWLARKAGCPYVLTAAGTYGVLPQRFPLDRAVYRRVLRQASLVCPISHGTARQMQRYFGDVLASDRLQPVLIGTDAAQAFPRGAAMERPFPDTPTLLSVGDVKPRKGQHVSLRAFARVQHALPEARYWIVGRYWSNEYFRQLQTIIREHDLRNVEFTGAVPQAELVERYRTASVFVLTPQEANLHFEGFGLVYLEAGAYGLPVVASRTGGVPDAVRDGETGLLVEPEDVDGLAQALLRLLTEPELARSMGRRNREWSETLTWERYAREQHAAYRGIFEGMAP